jgi:hypothetical protein
MVAVIVLLVYLSNRSVRRAQEQVIPKPADSLNVLHPHAAYYVSTVFADKALSRVWAHGLGGRGRAFIAITPEGISVSRQGETGFLIPTKSLTGVSIDGNAGSATNATNAVNIGITDDTSTNADYFPVWVTNSTGNLPAKVTSTKLKFNPSSGAMTVTGGIGGGAF